MSKRSKYGQGKAQGIIREKKEKGNPGAWGKTTKDNNQMER
jgi:hypothetical protein